MCLIRYWAGSGGARIARRIASRRTCTCSSSNNDSAGTVDPSSPLCEDMAAAAPRRLLSAAQLADYDRDGFVKCDNWLAPDEVAQLLEIAKADKAFTDAARDLEDDEGNISRLSLRMWELPEDSYSAFVRHEALVHPMEQLLGGDTGVYHYHHKMMLKEPRTGGAWEWQCVLLMPPLVRLTDYKNIACRQELLQLVCDNHLKFHERFTLM